MWCQFDFFFLCLILQQVRGWKVVCEQNTYNSVCRTPFSYFFVHSNMRWVLYIQIILFRDMAHWRAQFFARASAVPTPPVPAASAAVSRHTTARAGSLPSVLSRSEPSHSRVTRHPCLAAKLNLPELQPWWVQFGSDQIAMGFCLARKSSAIFENDVFLFLRAANCKKPASF